VLEQLAPGRLEVVATEDLSRITAAGLAGFDAVFFFTSGELALSAQQKADLLDFVRNGKGFGGAHSATDTLYNWPEYGELIGAYFDGHPWTQEIAIDVENPDHPAMAALPSSFRIMDEIYQHRAFSRDRVRVLMTLDTATVDLGAQGVNRTDGDFALAWVAPYGRGRVFYTALGHFDETWLDPRIRAMLEGALLWLAGAVEGDAAPRNAAPALAAGSTGGFLAPGTIFSLYGADLTTGATMQARTFPLPRKLAGASVLVNGSPAPLLFVSPAQINVQLPYGLSGPARITVRSGVKESAAENAAPAAATPFLFAVQRIGDVAVIWCTGLGDVRPPVEAGVPVPASQLPETLVTPVVTIGGARAEVRFSGLSPFFSGLYQVNASIPVGTAAGAPVEMEAAGRRSNSLNLP